MLLKPLFWLVLGLGVAWVPAAGESQPRVLAQGRLEALASGKPAIQVDAGGQVNFKISYPPDGSPQETLEVQFAGQKVASLEGGKFYEYVFLELGPELYWIISEFTGGAHCCGKYHFLARDQKRGGIIYLGDTRGHNGPPRPIRDCLRYKQGRLFFQDLDNRFDYFHESHAGSLLVNLPERFYELDPQGLKVNNLAFREIFLEGARKTQREIQQALKRRHRRPPAILAGGPEAHFSDRLGQLLVKQTLYLLYARKDQEAWNTLAREVGRHYQSTRFLPELKQEILELLKDSAY